MISSANHSYDMISRSKECVINVPTVDLAKAVFAAGVPFFVLAGRWAVSGAQEPAMLVGALDEVAAALA